MNKTVKPTTVVRFSDHLEAWLKSNKPKTLQGINDTFAEKGFAVSFLLLMILPALPIPTGGITHIFEIATIILAAQLAIGRKTFWLPGFLGDIKLGRLATGKIAPAILKLIRKLEKFSRPRGTALMQSTGLRCLSGLAIIGLALTAFLSLPFSGLDTLPSLGVVTITLGIILDDIVIYIIGLILGLAGVLVVAVLGTVVTQFIHHLF